jgi:hypothetical protein
MKSSQSMLVQTVSPGPACRAIGPPHRPHRSATAFSLSRSSRLR